MKELYKIVDPYLSDRFMQDDVDLDSVQYWPLVPDAPKEVVDAYKELRRLSVEAKREGKIID